MLSLVFWKIPREAELPVPMKRMMTLVSIWLRLANAILKGSESLTVTWRGNLVRVSMESAEQFRTVNVRGLLVPSRACSVRPISCLWFLH